MGGEVGRLAVEPPRMSVIEIRSCRLREICCMLRDWGWIKYRYLGRNDLNGGILGHCP